MSDDDQGRESFHSILMRLNQSVGNVTDDSPTTTGPSSSSPFGQLDRRTRDDESSSLRRTVQLALGTAVGVGRVKYGMRSGRLLSPTTPHLHGVQIAGTVRASARENVVVLRKGCGPGLGGLGPR